MHDVNLSILLGRATEDIKVQEVNNSFRYSFILAVNYYSRYTNKKYSDFIPVCIWKDNKEPELEQLQKGGKILIEGRINVRSYQKNNEKKWISEVRGEDYQILEYKESKNEESLDESIKENEAYLDELNKSQSSTKIGK